MGCDKAWIGHHVRARLDIGAVGIGARQIFLHQAHPLQCHALRHWVVMRRAEGFQTMCKGIHTGPCGNGTRHPDRQFGVADDHGWQDFGVEDDFLFVADGIGDDRRATDFGPGSGRRRYGDNGGDAVGVRAGPPVVDILEIPDRSGLACHEGHELAKVEA